MHPHLDLRTKRLAQDVDVYFKSYLSQETITIPDESRSRWPPFNSNLFMKKKKKKKKN